MKRLISLLTIITVSVFSGLFMGAALNVNPIYPGVASFICSFVPLPQGSLYSLLFTAPGGVATPFTFSFKSLPQFISFNNVVPLTSLRVETKAKGVLHDWVALSITALNGYMVQGAQAANIVQFRLANGFLAGEDCTISGVTSAAGAIGFYGFSDTIGTNAFKTTNAQINALEPCEFIDFTAVWVPAMAAVTDYVQIEYSSGLVSQYNINDLQSASSLFQEVPAIIVNNANAYIHKATFVCAAAHPAYVLSILL